MNLAHLIPIAVKVSMWLIVFSVALHASLQDVGYLLRRPGLLVRSLLAMNVLMPFVAVLLAVTFRLNPVVETALIVLAFAPVPPILPNKELKAGGSTSYVLGVLVASGLFAMVFAPAAVELLARVFHRSVHVSSGRIAEIVATSLLAPLVAGLVVRRLIPSMALRVARVLALLGTLLLVVALVPVLVSAWPAMLALVGNYSVLAIAGFVLTGLALGYALGGPNPDDRTVLGLSCATRHPAIAMAIAQDMAFERQAMSAAVLLVLLVGVVVSVPFVRWRRHRHEDAHPPGRTRVS